MPDFELKPQLIILYPQKMFKQFPLEKGTQVLGRGQDADIRLEDELVSRRHCEVSFDGQNVTVTDLGSTNGTYVDGNRIQTTVLGENNRLQVGCMVLKVDYETRQGLFDLKIYEASTKDLQTGVYNLKTFENRSFGEFSLARLNNKYLHIAVIKLENLNEILVDCGEQCSDVILKEVARILQEETRDHDLLARLSDNAFVLMVSGMSPEEVQKHVEKACSTVEHHRFSWKDSLIPVSLELKICSRQGQEVGNLQEMMDQCI